MTVKSTTDVKLGFGKQLGYAMGESAGQFFFGFWGSFLSIYYTDVVGLAPAIVSVIFMAARVWDAINDPMFGNIADRHRHRKHGRYRPWILYGTPVLAISSILVFSVPKVESESMVIVYVTITYILAGMAFTAVNIPYMSLQSTLTTNMQSRGDIANLKGAFTFVGVSIINVFTAQLVTTFAGSDSVGGGYFYTAVLYSIIGAAMYYIMFASTKEMYFADASQSKASLKETFAYVFGNRNILMIMTALFLSMMGTFGRIGVTIYYYIYNLHAMEMIGILMVAPTLCSIIPTYVIPKIPLERKTLIIIAFIGRSASLAALFFVDYTNITAVLVCLVIMGLFSFETGMVAGLIAPAIDEAELKTGKRMDGTVFAMVNLAAKMASALGGSIGLLVMGAMGYVANTQQSDQSLLGINLATNVIPAIFCLLAIIPIAGYSLNAAKVQKNTALLAEKHANLVESPSESE